MTSDTADAPKAQEARKVPSYIESLPEDVKDRITSLQGIQKKHDEIEAEFQKEKAALYAKYEKLYSPFYDQRANIVNDPNEVSKGIPEFWLNALKSNTLVRMQIYEKDQEALKYLKDIKSFILTEPRGFKLEFHFAENPFFANTVLTKEYHMAEDEEPILEKAIGTNIDWKNGKTLTEKLMKKKPKKGAEDAAPVFKTVQCDSFFNFFKPPDVPDNEDDINSEEMEDLQDILEQDYDIGATIREKIIPHAVSWYTGEAEDYDDDDDDDDEIESDEDFDEDGEDGEDGEDEGDEEDSDDDEEADGDKAEPPALVKGDAKTE